MLSTYLRAPFRRPGLLGLTSGVLMMSCAQAPENERSNENSSIATVAAELTAQDRLAACAQDPRVVTGLVSAEVCAGADIFFRETFDGNGRTCGTCHRVENNMTIDVPFIAALDPGDPLFVFEQVPALAQLETPSLRQLGMILENVDGFEDPTNKFVVRGVPHTLSLATHRTADTGDGTTIPPLERVGWGGDGPGDGSLRAFLLGAIEQHATLSLDRVPGVDFRVPTSEEEDLVLAFQLSMGRLNELNLSQVNLLDAGAREGKDAFVDPQRGRCNFCHANAGGNSEVSGLNRNFDSGTRLAPAGATTFGTQPNGLVLFDGGFGGSGLSEPNFDALNLGFLNAFGNGTFSTPPVIEAVDTVPFFHTNAFGQSIEAAISFYNGPQFAASPAAAELEQLFGTPVTISNDDLVKMGRFLRVLSAAFNLDIAKQRLRASQTILNHYQDAEVDIQKRLIELAEEEIDDAIAVLTFETGVPSDLHPFAVERLGLAKAEIAAALAAPNAGVRGGPLSTAISRVENARDHFGANITFQLGEGNLMF